MAIFSTGEALVGDPTLRCRQITWPDDQALTIALNGALSLLCQPDFWSEVGTMTANDAASYFSQMLADMANDCGGGENVLPRTFSVWQGLAQGTNGGSSSAATVHTRSLNAASGTVVQDVDNWFEVPEGTWIITARAPCHVGARHYAMLEDYDTSDIIAYGENAFAAGTTTHAQVTGKVTSDGTLRLRVRHYVQSAVASTGLGAAVNHAGRDEVYTTVNAIEVKP